MNKLRPINAGLEEVPHHTLAYSSQSANGVGSNELIRQSSQPLPIFSIKFPAQRIKDPATALVLPKQLYERQKSAEKSRWKLSEKPPEGIITQEMIEFIETSETQTLSYAGAEYDWHFTGGSLEVVTIGKNIRLAQASMSNIFDVRILYPFTDFNHTAAETTIEWFNESYIYELMKSEAFLAIRRNKSISFVPLTFLNDYESEYKSTTEIKWMSEIAASALGDQNQLIFADVTNSLYRINIDKLLVNSVVKMTPPNQLEPISINCVDKNVVSYTNLKALHLADFRTDKVEPIFDSSKFHMKCEELSYHKSSLHDNLLYLASSHLLYGIDLRFTKQPLIHWSHQLIQQPTMLKSVRYIDDEVICLSSNMQGDMKIFNCSKESQSNSWCISRVPVKPYNIKSSYQTIREKGLLLLSDPVKHRASLSNSGIAMIANKKQSRIQLFTQNSIGDVFSSVLQCSEHYSNDQTDIAINFLQWDKALQDKRSPLEIVKVEELQKKEEMHFTCITKLKGLRKYMLCEKLCAADDYDEANEMKTERVPAWKIEIEEAREYRDALSQHLLAEWDLQIEETKPKIFAEALASSNLSQTKKVDMVSQWLEMWDPKMESTFPVNNSYYIKDEPVAQASITFEEVFRQEAFGQEILEQEATQTTKKTKKVSQRRVIGFY